MIALALLAALPQASTSVPAPPLEGTSTDGQGRPVATRKIGTAEAAKWIGGAFDHLDADRSGFVENAEIEGIEARGALRDHMLPAAPSAEQPDLAVRRKWLGKMDQDRDGRISREEYIQYMMPWILLSGVPADWHPAPVSAARPAPLLPPVEDVAWRPASPEEIRVLVADSFLTMDRDHSGFIERTEAPQGSAGGEGGRIGDPVSAKDVHPINGRAGQAMWIGLADADADGRVSLAEWLAYDVPNMLALGKLPADWRGMEAARVAGAGG